MEGERLLSLEGHKMTLLDTKVTNQNYHTRNYNSLRMRLSADTSGRGRRCEKWPFLGFENDNVFFLLATPPCSLLVCGFELEDEAGTNG